MEQNKYEHYLKYIGGVRFWIITTGVIVAFVAMKQAGHIVNMILMAAGSMFIYHVSNIAALK